MAHQRRQQRLTASPLPSVVTMKTDAPRSVAAAAARAPASAEPIRSLTIL
jgi:hypothetical protein